MDGLIIDAVRDDRHDVRWMAEELGGTKDSIVLEAAVLDARILITKDKDFGELVYRQRRHHRGVVLVRVDGISNLEPEVASIPDPIYAFSATYRIP
ncbi:MAG: DUF5615 family PIN-like protein [Pirellulales bacterium]